MDTGSRAPTLKKSERGRRFKWASSPKTFAKPVLLLTFFARFVFMGSSLWREFVANRFTLHKLACLVSVAVDDFPDLASEVCRNVGEHVPVTEDAQEPIR